jgi:hypothetical protein
MTEEKACSFEVEHNGLKYYFDGIVEFHVEEDHIEAIGTRDDAWWVGEEEIAFECVPSEVVDNVYTEAVSMHYDDILISYNMTKNEYYDRGIQGLDFL